MQVIEGDSVTDLFIKGLKVVTEDGNDKTSIGNLGKEVTTKEIRPVVVINHVPTNNVLMVPFRNNNPFAQAAEGLWTLAGRNDVEFLDHFISALKNYSDDGKTYRAAYGHRLTHFDTGEDRFTNQIVSVVAELSHDWRSRRAAMSVWHPFWDNYWWYYQGSYKKGETKDTPCNDFLMFKVVEDESNQLFLDMTVINRSNDLILGLFNVNVIQFSLIQQLIATMCGFRVGTYYHYTDSLHIYEKDNNLVGSILDCQAQIINPYDSLSLGLGRAEFSEAWMPWMQSEEPNEKINCCRDYIQNLDELCTGINGAINAFNQQPFASDAIRDYMRRYHLWSSGYKSAGFMYVEHVVPFIWAYPIIKGLYKYLITKPVSDSSHDAITFAALDTIKTLINSSICQDWIIAGYRFIARKFYDTDLEETVKIMIKNALDKDHYKFLEHLWAVEEDVET